ncbi:MAG: hybrid sensor histidine kinase/response regulator [Bacteroidales bacterium]
MNLISTDFRILIVDDIPANILLLKIILEKEGYQVETAESGEEALLKIDEQLPDLILLDVMMPGMSGYQVADIVREREEWKEVGIIFITALTGSNNVVEGFKHGGNDYISKPFNKEEFLIKIKHQLSLSEAKRLIKLENEKLQKTIQSRDTLYSIIAHDLRSPLGSIKMTLNTLSLLITDEQIGEDLREMLKSANKTTEDLFSLLDNLLKWTKSLTGRLNVVFQEMNLVEIISGIAQVFEIGAQLKGIRIEIESPEIAITHCDVDMIKTVIRNLLSNAIKFSNANSVIRIKIACNDARVEVHISDQGIGMNQEQQQKLIARESFTSYGTKNEEGSGLGLTLCRDFIQKNNGSFWFTSEPGKGSTFSFALSLSQPVA